MAAVIPQDLGAYWWKGRDWDDEWSVVYGHLDELYRDICSGGDSVDSGAEEGEGKGEEEGQDEEVIRIDSEGAEEEEDDGKGGDANKGDDDEVTRDGDAEAEVREKDEQEREERDMVEAATELVLPECLVNKLDRADVLAVFRSSRDRESYNHTDLWDNN